MLKRIQKQVSFVRYGNIRANPLNLGMNKVVHLPNWGQHTTSERMRALRQICMESGRDPRIREFTVKILLNNRIEPRDYKAQAACILKWVQKNIYYVNEPQEQLQDPLYTIKVGFGDCDDMVILLCSMFQSIRLDWKFVLSAKGKNGNPIRWIEGDRLPSKEPVWSHIYCMVGYPPFNPTKWFFCEPTLRKVPLGWDVVKAGGKVLPELGNIESEIKEKGGKLKRAAQNIRGELNFETLLATVVIASVTSIFIEEFKTYVASPLYKNIKKKLKKHILA